MPTSRVFRFAGFEFDEALRELRRDGRVVPVQPKPLALLSYLLHHRHRVVSRAELLEALWPGVVVQEDALDFALHGARRAVGDDGKRQRVIRTVSRQGFRLVAPVEHDAPPAPAPPAPSAEPFVGRAEVLAAFEAAISEACAGQGALILLAGEPGIGKTRTSEVVAERARARGLRALLGRCSEGDGAPAFWPWIQVLRALLRGAGGPALVRDLGSAVPEVARLIPELDGSLRAPPAAPAGDPRAARFLLFEGISRSIREAAREQPMLVVIDDLHRADQSSLLLLRHLAHDLQDARLLILAAYREAELMRDPARAAITSELLRQSRARALSLAGLSAAEVGELVLATTGQRAARAVREDMHEQTNGNPFFLHQIVRILQQEQRTEALGESRPLRFELPRRVQDAILHQLGGLPAGTLELLELAAVFGRDFRLGPLRHASGLDQEQLLERLARAIEARVIAEDRHPGDHRFAHVLVRDALYQRLDPVRRARLHDRAGRALEHWDAGGAGADPLELAHHFFEAARAGDARRGIDAAIRAGEWALARLAYDEAVGCFERARVLLDRFEPDDRRRRCEVQLALGDAQTRSGARDAARRSFAAVARVAKAMSLPHELAQAALRFAPDFLAIESGVYDDDLVTLLEEALDELAPADDATRARLLARLAVALHWAPGADPRLPALAEEAVCMAERLGDPATLRYVRCARALAQYSVADPERYLSEPSALALAPGDEPVALLEKMLHMTSLLWLGRVTEFDREIEHFARLAERLRQPQSRWYVDLFRAVRALMDGRYEDARRLMRRYQREGERAQDENVLHSLRLLTFMIAIDRGGVEPLGPAVAQMAERFPAMIGWRGGLALYYAEVGRHDDARRELEGLLREDLEGMRRRNDWSALVVAIAIVSALVGHEEGARRAHRLLEPYAQSLLVIGYASYVWGAASLALGFTAATGRDWSTAEAYLEDARGRHERIGARAPLAHTHFWTARMLLARGRSGDASRAREHLAAGCRLADELGMARLKARLDLLRDSLPAR
jgi:DNA-binding winged helix-turn-helix (wHTH) protein